MQGLHCFSFTLHYLEADSTGLSSVGRVSDSGSQDQSSPGVRFCVLEQDTSSSLLSTG